MDVKAALSARERVERLLADADETAADAHMAMDRLALEGIKAAKDAGAHPSLLGPTFTYVGKAQKAASDLIAALGGIHYHLHEATERLELQPPEGPAPRSGDGKGDKPPEPIGG